MSNFNFPKVPTHDPKVPKTHLQSSALDLHNQLLLRGAPKPPSGTEKNVPLDIRLNEIRNNSNHIYIPSVPLHDPNLPKTPLTFEQKLAMQRMAETTRQINQMKNASTGNLNIQNPPSTIKDKFNNFFNKKNGGKNRTKKQRKSRRRQHNKSLRK